MNRRRLLLIGILALASGAVVSNLIYHRLQAKVTPLTVTVDVVVAAHDIQVGAKIADRDLKVVKYPPDDLPAHVFDAKSSILERAVLLPVVKGQLVVNEQLADPNAEAGFSSQIAVGMRAEAVRVNDVTAVAGFAGPGTRVDVLVTGNPTGSNEPQTETILQNILVLAVGPKTDRSPTGEPQNAPVVTLLVSPEDSEKLALAGQEGRIQLVLRNQADTKQEATPAIKNTNLFSRHTPQQPTKPKRAESVSIQMQEIETIQGSQRENIRVKTVDSEDQSRKTPSTGR